MIRALHFHHQKRKKERGRIRVSSISILDMETDSRRSIRKGNRKCQENRPVDTIELLPGVVLII